MLSSSEWDFWSVGKPLPCGGWHSSSGVEIHLACLLLMMLAVQRSFFVRRQEVCLQTYFMQINAVHVFQIKINCTQIGLGGISSRFSLEITLKWILITHPTWKKSRPCFFHFQQPAGDSFTFAFSENYISSAIDAQIFRYHFVLMDIRMFRFFFGSYIYNISQPK